MIYSIYLLYTFLAGRKNTCAGDSGGPIMWKNPDTDRYIILGKTINSFKSNVTK